MNFFMFMTGFLTLVIVILIRVILRLVDRKIILQRKVKKLENDLSLAKLVVGYPSCMKDIKFDNEGGYSIVEINNERPETVSVEGHS